MSTSAPLKLTIKDYKSDLHNDWCPGCVHPRTQIVMGDRSRRAIRDVKVGDIVLGHDGVPHHVTEVMSHWHPGQLRRIKVRFLGELQLTDDHPVWCAAPTGDRQFHLDWRLARDVQAGDQIAIPASALETVREFAMAVAQLEQRRLDGEHGADAPYVLVTVEANDVIHYDGYVHNLEVEDSHSYVTDVAALHNCGDFGILTGIQMALARLQLDPDKVACFSGIGCSGKTPHYVNAYGFHTLHGRVLPTATGGRLANTDITVIALGGDGDGYGIGAGYFVNSGRRNLDFTYLVHDNNVYGLTKGQASPTLSKGKRTKSMPEQAIQDGINPIAMAVAAGYTFIARAYALEPKYTADIIARAIQHKGSALVDVLQTCPTYNDLYTKEWYEGADLPEKMSRLYKLEERGYDGKVQDPTDAQEIVAKKAAAVARSYEREPLPIGVYYEVELPTYEDEVFKRIPSLRETPLAEMDTFKRDVQPLLEAMR